MFSGIEVTFVHKGSVIVRMKDPSQQTSYDNLLKKASSANTNGLCRDACFNLEIVFSFPKVQNNVSSCYHKFESFSRFEEIINFHP
jgi:hypothetical protein